MKNRELKTAIIILGCFLVFGFTAKYVYIKFIPSDMNKVSMDQAKYLGDKSVYQVAVIVSPPPPGSKPDDPGLLRRGDVLEVRPLDREFSDGEKNSYLIIKMELTPAEAEVLVRSKTKEAERPMATGNKATGTLLQTGKKRIITDLRQYGINLGKIGIKDDEYKGRVIEDRVFGDEVIRDRN
jgi:hypothetical protein